MLKIKKSKPQIMYFDNDDDFYAFAVVPVIVSTEYIDGTTGVPRYSMSFNLSDTYHQAVDDGVQFVIKDENSKIFKRGCVTYRTINKPVQNLKQYFKQLDHGN